MNPDWVVPLVWSLLAASVVVTAWRARSPASRWTSFGHLLDIVTGTPWGLVLAALVWMWVGWHLFAR